MEALKAMEALVAASDPTNRESPQRHTLHHSLDPVL